MGNILPEKSARTTMKYADACDLSPYPQPVLCPRLRARKIFENYLVRVRRAGDEDALKALIPLASSSRNFTVLPLRRGQLATTTVEAVVTSKTNCVDFLLLKGNPCPKYLY